MRYDLFKIYIMFNSYRTICWKPKCSSWDEAKETFDLKARLLNKLLNDGKIKHYQVELY